MNSRSARRVAWNAWAVIAVVCSFVACNHSSGPGVEESRMYAAVPCTSIYGDVDFECKSPFVVSVDAFKRDARLSELDAGNNTFVRALASFVTALQEKDYGAYADCVAPGDEKFRSEEAFNLFGRASSAVASDPYVARMYQSGPVCVFAIRNENPRETSEKQSTINAPYLYWVFCKRKSGPAVFSMGNTSRTPLNSVLISVARASIANLDVYEPRKLVNNLSEVFHFGIDDFLEDASEFSVDRVYFQASNLRSVARTLRADEKRKEQKGGETCLTVVAQSSLEIMSSCARALLVGDDQAFLSCIRPAIRQQIKELQLDIPDMRATMEAMWVTEKEVLWCASGDECCIVSHQVAGQGGVPRCIAVYVDRVQGKYFLVSPNYGGGGILSFVSHPEVSARIMKSADECK